MTNKPKNIKKKYIHKCTDFILYLRPAQLHPFFRVSWYPAPANLPSEYLQWACGHFADLQWYLPRQCLKLAQHISQQQ